MINDQLNIDAGKNLQRGAPDTDYRVGIIGGGLAGLALAIQLSKAGHTVVLFEKEQYPFHRVCGEYISMESWEFLKRLGLQPEQLDVSHISQLELSSGNGRILRQQLPLGGFGVSRYLLDATLCEIARASGVKVMEGTKVNDISFEKEKHRVLTDRGSFLVDIACGTFGKRSNIDVKWKRPFTRESKNKLNNYIGVKYHVHTDIPSDTIGLHLFPGGYCGIVKIDHGLYNLCYLTTAANLQHAGGNIGQLEKEILSSNPRLKAILTGCKKVDETAITISQISFERKEGVMNHVLFCGDATGMITPLCGNGMSMALHGSKLLANRVHLFLEGRISRTALENQYISAWGRQFNRRLRAGRLIQQLFSNERLTGLILSMARRFPAIGNRMIHLTHGEPF